MSDIEKKMKVMDMLFQIEDHIFKQFFDIDSDKMLDDKIAVMTDLISGKKPADIPKYYEVLELYPNNEIWD